MFCYQSCVNQNETECMEPFVSCFYSHLLYRICENLHYELVYFKGLNKSTQRPRILKTDNIQSGGSCSEGHPATLFVK